MTPSAWSEEKLNNTTSNIMQLLAAAISKDGYINTGFSYCLPHSDFKLMQMEIICILFSNIIHYWLGEFPYLLIGS